MGILSWTFLAACLFTLAVAEDVEQNENYSGFRKVVCEKNNQELFDDLDECFRKEPQEILSAVYECYAYADPESKEDVRHFEKAACADISLFDKFDECYKKYNDDPEYKKKAELDPETLGCYKAVVDKHQLDELQSFFEESSESSESSDSSESSESSEENE